MATTKEHLEKHDREIAAIRKLVLAGMKLVVEVQREQKEFGKKMRELQASQKKTEAMLQDLIRSLKGGSNGHTKRQI
jgi:hypothetical protein